MPRRYPSAKDSPLLRRAKAARQAVRQYDVDPYLALYWVLWPTPRVKEAMKRQDEAA